MGKGHCSLSLEFTRMNRLIICPESPRKTKGTWVPASMWPAPQISVPCLSGDLLACQSGGGGGGW